MAARRRDARVENRMGLVPIKVKPRDMGCDWIEGRRVLFGYSACYSTVFCGTSFAKYDVLVDEGDYDADEQDPHLALSSAWAAFASERPELEGIGVFLGTTCRPGQYESSSYTNQSEAVFGYSLTRNVELEETANGGVRARLPDPVFPAGLSLTLREFLRAFRGETSRGESAADGVFFDRPRLVIFV
jgi:hypothetical protein